MTQSFSGDLGAVAAGAAIAGFGRSVAGLQALRKQTDEFEKGLSEGRFTVNPEAAHKAARAYEDAASQVSSLSRKVMRLNRVDGLGEYNSARVLAAKFGQKADGANGAADLLSQLKDEMLRKAELLKVAARDYATTNSEISEEFKRSVQQ